MNRRPPPSTATLPLSPPRPKRSPSVRSIFRPTTSATAAAIVADGSGSKAPPPLCSGEAPRMLGSGRGEEERGGDCRGSSADGVAHQEGDRYGCGVGGGGSSHARPRHGNPFDFVTGVSDGNDNNNKRHNWNNNNNNSNCPSHHAGSVTHETTAANDIFSSLFQWGNSPPTKCMNIPNSADATRSTPFDGQSTMPQPSQMPIPSKPPSTNAQTTTAQRNSLPPRPPRAPTVPVPSTSTAANAAASPIQTSPDNITSASTAFDPFFVVFHPFAQTYHDHGNHPKDPSSSSSPSSPTTSPSTPPDPSSSPFPGQTHNNSTTTHNTSPFRGLADSFIEKVEDFAASFPEMGHSCSPFKGLIPEAEEDDDIGAFTNPTKQEEGKHGCGDAENPSDVEFPSTDEELRAERAAGSGTGARTSTDDGASTTSATSSFLEIVGEITNSWNPCSPFGDGGLRGGDLDCANDDGGRGGAGMEGGTAGWDVHFGKVIREETMLDDELEKASNGLNANVPLARCHRSQPLPCPPSSINSSRDCHASNSPLLQRVKSLSPILHILPSKYHDEWNAISSYPQQQQTMETSPSFPDLGLDGFDNNEHHCTDTDHADNGFSQRRYQSRSVDSDVIFHGETRSLGKNRTRSKTLDNHTILSSPSYHPNHNLQHSNRKRTTTIESVMAVISLTSTAKSVASPWKDGKSSDGDSGGTAMIENDESGRQERGKNSTNVVVVHDANAGGLEAFASTAHEDSREWFEGEEGITANGAGANRDPAGRGKQRHFTPIQAIYPIPPLCRTSSDGDYDDASAVSSLSDDERYGFRDDEHDDIGARRKKKHYRKHSSSDRGSSDIVGSGGATPSGGGVRAISAFLKKPVELANKMGATGAAIVRQPSTARDTVTTAATTTAHTLETINTPQTPIGKEWVSTWRSMGQNTSNNDSLTSFGHSPGRADSGNSIGSDTFTSQRGYHRRCKYGMNGLDSSQRLSQRISNTGQQSMVDNTSWIARSPGMYLSPGARPSIPSPGSIMYENALINYKRTPMAPRSHPLAKQPSTMRLPPLSPPVSPRMNSKEFQGIPSPIILNACENSVVSGTSSTGWTLQSSDRQIPNCGTMSTSSVSHGTLGGRPMMRSSSITHSFQRPPMATRAKSVQEIFDPLSEMNSQFGNLSIGTPSSNPPRYLKDDPLLSNSRYRGRLITSPSIRKSKKISKKSKEKHVIDKESACMIGTIALAETDPLSPLKCGGISQRSFTNSHDCITPQGTFDSLNSPHDASTTPNSHQISPSLKVVEYDEDDATCEFAEEFHRRDKSNVVKDEIKHFIGKFKPKPVVKVGRKLLGRDSPSKNLKRADGCLT